MAEPSLPSAEAVTRLDASGEAEARLVLERCCGSSRWVEGMLRARPFVNARALLQTARKVWAELGAPDFRQAFAHHPEIGVNIADLRRKFGAVADLSQAEQAGASGATEITLQALARDNRSYRERFGYSFIVCATGKSAEDMLALLQARLEHSAEEELVIAASEQAKITQLRLEKI
jgi:2-oxo-4-hydroxy-4-carboxy-5-ureidoimidazoline decarboxylase